jgi:hypothetical protein
MTPIFIPRLLLWRLFSFPALSYCAYFLCKYRTGIIVYIEYQSVCPFVWIGPPHPLHHKRKWLHPSLEDPIGGGGHNRFRGREWGDAYFRFAYFPITLSFIWRLLLRCIFSFSAFSYDAYFHSAHSPMTHIFIQRILLMHQFSFRAFSYDAYFHYASSLAMLTLIPRILLQCLKNKEGAERKWHFKGSDQRENRGVWSNINTRYLVRRCGDGRSFVL